jgi:FkbM family methyltransferase
MKTTPHAHYRLLFWSSMFCSALVFVLLYIEHQRLVYVQTVGDPRSFEPHFLSELRDVNYPFTIEVYGYKYQGISGNFIDDRILAYGAYEKDVLFFMRDYIKAKNDPESIFIDVGANTGQHSLFMSRHVKRVHAFEPFPPVAERFRRMIELNGFSNIVLHEVGLGKEVALVPFFVPPSENLGGGTFLTEHATHYAQGPIKPTASFRVVVGDKWLDQFQVSSIELIKIDVEGYEEFVLAGLSLTLAKNRPVVVVEVSRPPSGTIGSVGKLRKFFPNGYRFRRFETSREQFITGKYKLVRLDRLSTGTDFEMVVAYPDEREGLGPIVDSNWSQ